MAGKNKETGVEKYHELVDPGDDRMLFRDRLAGKDVRVRDVTFKIKALPAILETWIHGQCALRGGGVDRGLLALLYAKFGVVTIDGLKDYDPEAHVEEILILGRVYTGLSTDVLDRLSVDVTSALYGEIETLTMFGEQEKVRLDFIESSENSGSSAEPGSSGGEAARKLAEDVPAGESS